MIDEIADFCLGSPLFLSMVGMYIRAERTMKNYLIIIREIKKRNPKQSMADMIQLIYYKMRPQLRSALVMAYILAYNIRMPCFYFYYLQKWNSVLEWNEVVLIVGEDEMRELQCRGMLRKVGKVVVLQDILKAIVENVKASHWISKSKQWKEACKLNKMKRIIGLDVRIENPDFESLEVDPSDVDVAHKSLQLLFLSGKRFRRANINGKLKGEYKQLRCLCLEITDVHHFPFQRLENFEKLRWLAIGGSIGMKYKNLYSICHLSSLRTLIINVGEKIEQVPNEFGNLKSLEILEFSSSKITQLPPFSFPHLKMMALFCGALISLPQDLASLQSLEILKLGCRSLENSTEEFGQLKSLRELILYHSEKINELPSGFYQLKLLRKVEIAQCHIAKLEKDIGNLTALEVFHLTEGHDWEFIIQEFSRLKKLPSNCWGSLAELKELSLSLHKETKTLPSGFSKLPKLQVLRIWQEESLEALPHDFGLLTTLKSLVLHFCKSLKTLSDDFIKLSMLEELYISNCGIEALPNGFSSLISLKKLTIQNCPFLSSLPDDFGKLPKLERLTISRNKNLRSLPESLGLLSELEYLDMKGNTNLNSLSSN